MNVYNFHSKPESLYQYEKITETNPDIFWEKYENTPGELKKREAAISKSTKYSYLYALDVLKGPFPAGEAAIAADAYYAHRYAEDVLNGPFPAGEAVIAKDVYFAHQYAKYALKKDFYLDGKLIAKFEK